MKKDRKIIAYLAVSADGYIARRDGTVDWLERPRPKGDYGYSKFFRFIDTILWGRKTYDLAVSMGVGTGVGPKIKNYVFSHRPQQSTVREVEFVNEPIGAFAQRLRAEPGKQIWMMGGAGLIASFVDAGEIDEFSIHVIPVLIGDGIPLLEPKHRLVRLKLISTRLFPDGIVHLNYRVLGETPGKTKRQPSRKKGA